MMSARWLVLLSTLTPSLIAEELVLTVEAGGHARENCPVTFALPAAIRDAEGYALVREADQEAIAVQRFGPKRAAKLSWMIHDRLRAGEKRKYRLKAVDHRSSPRQRVRCSDDGAKLNVTVDGSRVLSFNHAVVEAPEGIDSVYRRSGYFHPVLTPMGNAVTGDFEPDHPHQHGLFNAWVNTTFRGQPVDFWNQAKGQGDVTFAKFMGRAISGPVFGQFRATLNHVASDDGKRVPAMTETILVRVYAATPFLFEIVSRQTPATADSIRVNEYHYGGIAIRGPSEWLSKGPAVETEDDGETTGDPRASAGFLTSSQRTRDDGNHTRARWVEMHGPIGPQHAGIIVLGAPSNFRAPQTVRLHPNKPYFCFAPMVLGEFTLEQGDVYVSRFRYVVHDGGPDPELAERMWQDLAHPPKVTFREL